MNFQKPAVNVGFQGRTGLHAACLERVCSTKDSMGESLINVPGWCGKKGGWPTKCQWCMMGHGQLEPVEAHVAGRRGDGHPVVGEGTEERKEPSAGGGVWRRCHMINGMAACWAYDGIDGESNARRESIVFFLRQVRGQTSNPPPALWPPPLLPDLKS